MGNRGRFGKYGDIKRIERLRKSRIRPDHTQDSGVSPPKGVLGYEKKRRQRAQVVIRRAKLSEAEYIGSLGRKAFEEYGTYDDMLPRWFLSGMTVTLLALAGKRITGFAMLGGLPHEFCAPGISELLAIAVEPESQGQGIGDLLMRGVVREAKAQGIGRLILHTAVKNVAGQRLFEKHGFIASEVKKTFYPQGQDALMMYRDIGELS
jgi:ribosomal protein S18 acetylase RimI-like enzyme